MSTYRAPFLAIAFAVLPVLWSAWAQNLPNLARVPVAPDKGLHVVLLGTGIPLANPDRATAATLIVADGKTFLVDTGRNSMVRLVEAGYQDVNAVLFTHFHSDHFAGFGEIMVNRGIAGAQTPLTVYGPKGVHDLVAGLLNGYEIDFGYREAHHGELWHEDAVRADVHESEPGVIYEKDGLRITMFDVDHRPIEPAVGYRFDLDGKSVVVSGDTVKSANLIKHANDCDVLVHEAMDDRLLRRIQPMLARTNPRMKEMIDDLLEYHTPTLEVAEVAKESGAKKLVLTHLIPTIPPNEAAEQNFVRDMAEIYSGPILVGRDGMVVSP